MFPTIWNEFDMLTDAFLDVNDDNSNIKTLATIPQNPESGIKQICAVGIRNPETGIRNP